MDFFYKTILLIAVLTVSKPVDVNAQFTYNLSKYQVGGQLGGMVSRTSLTYNTLGAYNQMHPSVSVFAERSLYKSFSVRANILLGQIGSDDSKVNDPRYPLLPYRDFKYRTDMAEVSTMLVWNMVKEKYNIFDHSHSNRFTSYLFIGYGLSFVKINRYYSGVDERFFGNTPTMIGLALDTTQNLPTMVSVFPMGGGLKYAITPQWTIQGELNFRYTYQPFLDGFSFSTPRVNSKDFYYGLSIGAAYRPFGKDFRNKCPASVL